MWKIQVYIHPYIGTNISDYITILFMFISAKESSLRDFLKDRGCLLLLTRIPTYSWSITAGIPFHQQMKGIPSIKVLVECRFQGLCWKVLRMMISPVYYKYTTSMPKDAGKLVASKAWRQAFGPLTSSRFVFFGDFFRGQMVGENLFVGNLQWREITTFIGNHTLNKSIGKT